MKSIVKQKQNLKLISLFLQYVCRLCGRACAQAGNLKSHYRHYHKVIVKKVSMFQDNDSSIFEQIPINNFDRSYTSSTKIEE